MLSRPFEQTRWHAIVITTLFWGGGDGKYQVSRILHPIVGCPQSDLRPVDLPGEMEPVLTRTFWL